jgi:phosphoribosylformylglycinamidine synthase
VSRPTALVVQAPGTNRDGDVSFALDLAGAEPRIVLLSDLLADPAPLDDARLLVLPGGFSHADSLGAGRMFGLELALGVGDLLHAFVDSGRPVIGICNGFQTLVRTGLLPGGSRSAALGHNANGSFQCRWVSLTPASELCVWTRGLDEPIDCPIAHGEGRFTCDDETLDALRSNDQIALRYAGSNPNGSVDDIAGVCDPTGLVLGLMPHPENHVIARQHPRHRRGPQGGLGLRLFENGVRVAKDL